MTIIILSLIVFIITAMYLFLSYAPQIGARPSAREVERINKSELTKEGTFQNVIPTFLSMSPRTMINAGVDYFKGGAQRRPAGAVRTVAFDRDAFCREGNGEEAAIAWFGHSTLLIRLQGITILTDPVISSERASMFSFMGPKRFAYTNHLRVEELPPIDILLLSHDHYDHLDYPTIMALKDKVNRFRVPLGTAAHLVKWGVPPGKISELEWWERIVESGTLTLDCVPSRHFSGRSLSGRNTTLWCSWIISGKNQKIYFGADSGYSPSFKAISSRYGPFDLNILECGAYSQYWPDIHMEPEQTIQAHLDLGGRYLMPIHWGKFSLSLHGWLEPIERLEQKAAETGITLLTPRIGEIQLLKENTPAGKSWWKEYQ